MVSGEKKLSEMITPEEMSPRLGMKPDSIREQMRLGTFPIGWAHQSPRTGNWRYHIRRVEFEHFMESKQPSNFWKFVREELRQMLSDA